MLEVSGRHLSWVLLAQGNLFTTVEEDKVPAVLVPEQVLLAERDPNPGRDAGGSQIPGVKDAPDLPAYQVRIVSRHWQYQAFQEPADLQKGHHA